MSPRACVAGVGVLPMNKYPGASPTELALDAIALALADAGLEVSDVDGLFTCPHGFMRERERFLTQRMAQRLELAPKAIVEMDAGGTSSGLTFQLAVRAVEAGQIRCALVYAAEVEHPLATILTPSSNRAHLLAETNAHFGSYDAAYGLVSVIPLYAMAAQRYIHTHKLDAEAVAQVAVVLRDNAAHNPLALFRQPMSVADVLGSRLLSPPIHLLEACPWANGAAAILVTCEDLALRSKKRVVRVLGLGEAHDPESFFPTRADAGLFPSIGRATHDALSDANLSLEAVDVFEVYGTFTAIELMCYEELGIFGRGAAARAVAEGRTRIAGDRPINPSGGRLSLGHPPYVTPLAEIAEIATQLRGGAGARQVRRADVGLVQAEHGMINGATVAILGCS